MALQNKFLESQRDNQSQVSVFLVNGIKLVGTIKDYDDLVILLSNYNKEQIIYKHSISTIVPE